MKKGIIVASFGSSYEETRRLCIESIEKRIEEEFPNFTVLRAFTSRVVVKILKTRDKISILNEIEALEEMKRQGIEEVYIQALHIIPGHEYEKLTKYNLKVGPPLLSGEDDFTRIVEDSELNDLGDNDALVFMGHGSDHEADQAYEVLENTYHARGKDNVFIGTVEGSKTIEDIIDSLKERNYKKIRLKAFMLVAGDHVINDMASDEEESWKSILEREGFEVEVSLKGLGEYKLIQDIFLDHLKDLMV